MAPQGTTYHQNELAFDGDHGHLYRTVDTVGSAHTKHLVLLASSATRRGFQRRIFCRRAGRTDFNVARHACFRIPSAYTTQRRGHCYQKLWSAQLRNIANSSEQKSSEQKKEDWSRRINNCFDSFNLSVIQTHMLYHLVNNSMSVSNLERTRRLRFGRRTEIFTHPNLGSRLCQ